MAKAGMRRPEDEKQRTKKQHLPYSAKNDAHAVPEIQGKAKHGNEKANPIIAGTDSPDLKVYHSTPHAERPVSSAYSTITTDLGRDNLENDIPAADLQDL